MSEVFHSSKNRINFDNSVANFPNLKKLVLSYEDKMLSFVKEKKLDFYVEDIPTLAFNPFEKKIIIGYKLANEIEQNPDDNFLKLKLGFGLYHELSHFRDLKVEQDLKGKSSMKSQLQKISKKNIKVGGGEYLSISEQIHDLYNNIDDIVVNEEVKNFIPFDVSEEDFRKIYKEWLFPSYDENGKLIFDGDVDYTKKFLYQQFPYFFLRTSMAKDQKVVLDPYLQNVVQAKTITSSYKEMKKLLDKKIETFENSDDEELKKRYEKVKTILKEKQILLNAFKISNFNKILSEVRKSLKGYFPDMPLYINWSFKDLMKIFTLTKGKDDGHHLIVDPALRYKIIENLIEPIQEILILLDWVEKGKIQDPNKKGEGQEGEGQKGKYKKSNTGSGGGMEHDDMDIEEKIKLLDELEEQDRKEQQSKKQIEKAIRDSLNNVFDNSGVQEGTLKILNRMNIRNKENIEKLVKFFEEQLKTIVLDFDEVVKESRKGKPDYKKITKEITRNPINPNFKNPIYTQIDDKETDLEKFKKLDFVFVIDISGSMDFHKGEYGILSNIIYIFSQVLMHLEKTIQHMTNDMEYKINIDFVLYGDDIGFSTLGNKEFELKPTKVKFAKVFEEIQRLSGGTNDRVGWQKVNEVFKTFFTNNPDYVQELKEGKRTLVINQIADTDVTEDGVEVMKNTLKNLSLDEYAVSLKRLVLGYYQEIKDIMKSKNWEDTKKGVKRQEFIANKKEILQKIMSLFNKTFTKDELLK